MTEMKLCLKLTVCNQYVSVSDLDPEVIGSAVGLLTMAGYIASGLGGFTVHLLIKWGGFEAWIASMIISSILAACTIIVGGMITVMHHKDTETSGPLVEEELVLRMSNASDIDIVAGILSASIRETDS